MLALTGRDQDAINPYCLGGSAVLRLAAEPVDRTKSPPHSRIDFESILGVHWRETEELLHLSSREVVAVLNLALDTGRPRHVWRRMAVLDPN